MKKVYNITNIKFENDYLILITDNHSFKIRLANVSDKLAKASDRERNDFKISPSGYGIHWKLMDEDLSIDGLINERETDYRSNDSH